MKRKVGQEGGLVNRRRKAAETKQKEDEKDENQREITQKQAPLSQVTGDIFKHSAL